MCSFIGINFHVQRSFNISVRKKKHSLKPEYPERTTDHGQAAGKLYHLRMRVECTLFCNLHSRARTHAVFKWINQSI
jgi:hypothetical protein